MQFTKAMIELVYQIRRFAPADLKPGIKLANPELMEELRLHYHKDASIVAQALIKEFFYLAGDDWINRLTQSQQAVPKQVVKVYRGQAQHSDSTNSEKDTNKRNNAKKRIYRGQVIDG